MQQTQINFERSEQLGLIRGADLPGTGNVKPDKLKAVLRVIDDHAGQSGWCYASQATIAREACMPLRTVQRAIVVLRDHLGVILTERKQSAGGTVINHARIVWTELAVLCEPHRSRRAAADRGACDTDELTDEADDVPGSRPQTPELRLWMPVETVSDQTAKTVDQTAKTDDQTAKTDDQTANTGGFNRKRPRSANEAPPPTPSWAEAAESLKACGLRMVPRAVLDAQQRGHVPGDVLAWCDEFRRWSARFEGPAAILWRIREGCWPVELPSREGSERLSSAAAEREFQRVFSRITYLGRRKRLPRDAITKLLRAQLPDDFLDRQTW